MIKKMLKIGLEIDLFLVYYDSSKRQKILKDIS